MATIRNPIEWSADHLRSATQHTASIARSLAVIEVVDALARSTLLGWN